MFKRLMIAGSMVGLSVIAAPLQAQASRSVGVHVTPYAGYMIFGDFLKGPVGTSVSNANGPLYGAQLGLRLGRGITLVGNVARASADLKIGLPFVGGLSVVNSAA